MKVLILATNYPTRESPNNGIFIHRQTKALADHGVDCTVLQPVGWAPPAPFHLMHRGWVRARAMAVDMYDEVEGVRVLHPRVRQPKPSRLFPGDYWERVGQAATRLIARRRDLRDANVLYAQFLCHEGYAGWIVKKQLQIPLAAIARGDDVHLWPDRWPDRKEKLALVLRDADLLLACSRALARDAERFAAKGLSRPLKIVYNGVDCGNYAPPAEGDKDALRTTLGLPRGRRLLLTVAAPQVSKGWIELLEAFGSISSDHPEWDLVGAGQPVAAGAVDLHAEANKRNLGGRFHWLGRTSPAHMPGLYRACDAFVLASHNEGLSNAVLEAMATALPVVATCVGGHQEVVENGSSGLLVPPGQVAPLTTALRRLLSDVALREVLGRNARSAVDAVGTPQANAALLKEYLGQVALRGPSTV